MSHGSTADISPELWTIVDGKLYLNLNDEVQKMWNEDMVNHIKSADKNWPKVINK